MIFIDALDDLLAAFRVLFSLPELVDLAGDVRLIGTADKMPNEKTIETCQCRYYDARDPKLCFFVWHYLSFYELDELLDDELELLDDELLDMPIM